MKHKNKFTLLLLVLFSTFSGLLAQEAKPPLSAEELA